MDKASLRQQLAEYYGQLWPGSMVEDSSNVRPPLFPGASQAAEQLRRLPAYRSARTIAVSAAPTLLQVRINALMDGKNLLAATPGLKRGLVRLAPAMVPINRRYMDLQGHAMFKAGKPLPLPRANLGQADMLVDTALAADEKGYSLGDGRGLLDVLVAMLHGLEVLPASAPLVLLLHEKQLVAELPTDPWDVTADLLITPEKIMRMPGAARPSFMARNLSPALHKLPIIKAFIGMRERKD